MKQVLSLENVSFSYQEQKVLEGVTFSINSGEFVGVFGPNGGGKTTLLKLIMGFLKPDYGTIEVFGSAPQYSQSRIAYVPQGLRFDRLFPISVKELVLSGRLSHLPWYGKFHSKDLDAADEMLEKVGLSNIKSHAFGTLSGGQAQRALIARALVTQPELLLLDEPTASVDSQAEREIYSILEELKGEIAILMVTHHLRTAIDQVDRVLCVRNNVISMQPEEVCEHFAIGLYHPPLAGG
ncbi:MAG: High-affinity zinc uptake system ATP-binding protein ZnuC [Chlamydiae bacterium]|nr:High-affinity zinc uptake system ATP-binding protein ZnuC [Chlamydiota bacterium]